ncbi:DUF6585 family protein [Dictyobacter formicarum]|uniref:YokE-like PH domain-containing protein n=1 Tax=Dictyobacter formicarum TaxID=2778368 RepID=A0ABQ3VR75_9CHLR|nr:DUF6585 family protein [Dictyobacter formicarum]GHO88772.1 hypothetical protein KSZ_67780 [Dictyobacter formicarum]
MSDQMLAEAYQLGKHHKLDQFVVTLKVNYKLSDLFYAFYLIAAIPTIIILLIFGFFFSTNIAMSSTAYYALVSTVSLLYLSILLVCWLRKYKPLLLPLRKDLHVHIYTAGFICVMKSQAEVVRWEQMKRVSYKRATIFRSNDTASVVKIWRQDGKKFVFNAMMKHIDILGQLAEREYQKRNQQAQATIKKKNISLFLNDEQMLF